MLFSTLTFLFVFLPIVLAGYYLINGRFKKIFMLIASLIFYAWGEPKFVLVMMATIIMNYVVALFIQVGGGHFSQVSFIRFNLYEYRCVICIQVLEFCNVEFKSIFPGRTCDEHCAPDRHFLFYISRNILCG